LDKDPGSKLVEIADELRAIATNGLHWSATEYDQARYSRVLRLAAEIMSAADTRSAEEIEQIFRGDLSLRSPLVGVEGAVFDASGKILLVQRADNGLWCMPGGLADVGESPASVAERETWEETGLQVEVRRLVGVYNSSITLGWPLGVHLYHLTFICEPKGGTLRLTNETTAYGWFSEAESAALPLHRGHAFRIPEAFAVYTGRSEGGRFH
jgi:8-oxo-dGTP pyrophosphatase MutT (NUDIX family)